MVDCKKVFDALRNCVTDPKCKDCPWEDCKKIGCKRTTVPVTLLLDTLNALKEQQETIVSLQGTINKLNAALAEQPEQKFFVGFDGKITPLPIQKHGNWIPIKTPTGVKYGGVEEYAVQEVMCSECGFTDDASVSIYTYCPECGAKMVGKVKP